MSEPRTFLDGRVTLFHDDCRKVLRGMEDNSVDSVCTDPPYHLTSIVKRFGAENAKPVTPMQKRFHNNGAALSLGPDGNPTADQYGRLSKGFMGKQWDGGDIAFQPELWAEVLRVLKPGGYIMAFSGCRTYHRMACAIEDAGFITHPFFAWAFGSGFPKAHNLSKQIDRELGAQRTLKRTSMGSTGNKYCKGLGDDRPWMREAAINGYHEHESEEPITEAAREWDGWFYGTQACKPALEPVYFGQKPFERGLNGAQNILKWGVGAINVAACRISTDDTITNHARSGNAEVLFGAHKKQETHQSNGQELGRWPSNLLLSPDDEVLACFPETKTNPGSGEYQYDVQNCYGDYKHKSVNHGGDSGSAARFFASFPQEGNGRDGEASANRRYADRGATTFTQTLGRRQEPVPASELFASFPQDEESVRRIFYTSKADADDRLGSKHPTVKPLDLIQYLVRLITPKNGVCLDLFAGTGTTAEACFREGFRCILIENDPESIADIERRMSLVMEGHDTRKYASMKARNRPRDDGPLFGGSEESPRHARHTGCIRNGDEGPFGYDGKPEAAE